MKNTEEPHDAIREFFKRWPTLYYVMVFFFGPVYLGYMSPGQFLKKFFPDPSRGTKILNLGSGPRVVRSDVINVDMTAYKSVAIQASLESLPFQTGEIDGFICDNVLEHVDDPTKVVLEMERILKPGGVAYISTPFLYPFHSSPVDHTRWTEAGLKKLFKNFEVMDAGTRSGYFSALTVLLCYGLSNFFSFGSKRLYWLLVNLSLIVFFPLKFLDVVANHVPYASHTAAELYCVIRKPHA